jgi:adhesin transport system outer membrane protein
MILLIALSCNTKISWAATYFENNKEAGFISAKTSPSLDLAEAVTQAINSHPSIKAARLNAEAAGSDLKSAKWQRFPSVSLETGVFEQDNYVPTTSAVLDLPLWTSGRIGSTIDRSEYLKLSAEAAYHEAILEIGLAVNQSYHDVIRLNLRSGVLLSNVEEHQKMVLTMERRVAKEVSPQVDLDLARSRLSQVEQQFSLNKAQYDSALQRLRELLSDLVFLPKSPNQLDSWPVIDLEPVITDGLAFSPRKAKLQADALAAGAEAKIIIASAMPQVSGQYSYNELYGYRFGVVLKAQTDAGFSRFAATDAAKMRQQSVEMQVNATESSLRDVLVNDHIEYVYASQRIGNADASAESSRRVTESYMRQFISGRRGWLDLMNAVRESTTAGLDAIDAHINASSAYSRILLRTGRWRPVISEATP